MASNTATLTAQQTITVKQGNTEKEILILPNYIYTFDSGLLEKGQIKTGKTNNGKSSFADQLYNAATRAADAGGNVFMITRMKDRNQHDEYELWGRAYYSDKYEHLKAKAFAQKDKPYENGRYAYIVVYRPGYVRGFNDETDIELRVNDTMTLTMKVGSKYVIKVPGSQDVRIANMDEVGMQHISAKAGKTYYVRSEVSRLGSRKLVKQGDTKINVRGNTPYFEQIDEQQGELESSLLTKSTMMKKLGQ